MHAFHLTRRARGLALWFSLAVHVTMPTPAPWKTLSASRVDAGVRS